MPDCFEGFSMETLAFFAAVKFNNNREFLNENRDLFERAVKRPLVLLAQELAPVAQEIDPLTGEPAQVSQWYSSAMLLFLHGVKRLGLA